MQLIPCALVLLTLLQSPAERATTKSSLEIPLWPNGTPGAPAEPGAEVVKGEAPDRQVSEIHVPTMTVYRLQDEGAARSAILICPGGGYRTLSIDKEGHDIARWCTRAGVVGIVVKSRLPRPEGHVYGHAAPLEDLTQAMRLVQENAKDWSIDPARVGVMGFSAGGHLAATASVHLKGGLRPAFSVLIYPVISMRPGLVHQGSFQQLLGQDAAEYLLARYSCEERVEASSPPAFLVHTSDDPVKVGNSLAYYVALQSKGVPSELHIFDRGGHGYGMRHKDLPLGHWPEALLRWLQVRGVLERG